MSYNQYLWSIFSYWTKDSSSFKEISTSNEEPADEFPNPIRPFQKKFQEITDKHVEVTNFLEKVKICNQIDHSDDCPTYLTGFYITAFCSGIEHILDQFWDDVIKLENDLLHNGSTTPMYVLVLFEPMSAILDSLLKVIRQINKDKIKGCKLFDLCHLFKYCGDPSVEEVYITIEEFCLKPLFMQLHYWLVKSQLYDPHDEFFIKNSDLHENDETSPTSLDTSIKLSQTEEKIVKEMPQYVLQFELLPNSIPLSTASQLLFIGEYLTIYQQNMNSASFIFKFTESYEDNYFVKALDKMCHTRPFNFSIMRATINELWSSVNKSLRRLVNKDGNVRSQLQQMADIYLLARGELFQEFLSNIMNELDLKASLQTERILNKTLTTAIYNVYLTDESELLGNMEFVIPRASRKTGDLVKNVIQVSCTIKWPLHYLFSPQIMDNYNRIFRFLLRLKKAQIDIHSIWMDINLISNIKLKVLAIEIRNQLLALIGNLQNYCFTDVIVNESNTMFGKLNTTETYTELQEILSSFQITVMARLFIMADEILKYFMIMFEFCETFSKHIKKSSPNLQSNLTIFKSKLEESNKSMFKFFETSETLMESLDIRNLLLNIDPNRYFRNRSTMSESICESQNIVLPNTF